MKINDLMIKYDDNDKYLKELNISKSDKIKSLFFGYLLSLMILFSPIVITSHFFIYKFYFEIIVLVISLLVVLFLLLGEIFHHKFLIYFSKTTEKRNLAINYLINSLMYLLICLICYIVIILLF